MVVYSNRDYFLTRLFPHVLAMEETRVPEVNSARINGDTFRGKKVDGKTKKSIPKVNLSECSFV